MNGLANINTSYHGGPASAQTMLSAATHAGALQDHMARAFEAMSQADGAQ